MRGAVILLQIPAWEGVLARQGSGEKGRTGREHSVPAPA